MPAKSNQFIEFQNVSFKFGDHIILENISTTIATGNITALIGRNGAGKTTFLRLCSGLLKPSNGNVFLNTISLSDMSPKERALKIGVVQQLPFAPDEMKVKDLVMLGRYPHLRLFAQESKKDIIAVEEALKKVGCLPLALRSMGSLSGGEKRKIFIARALAQGADIFLLDEPTANLDLDAQLNIFVLLQKLASEGATILVVLHDVNQASIHCDKVVLLHERSILMEGTPEQVLTEQHLSDVYGIKTTIFPANGKTPHLVVPVMNNRMLD
tara:strand:+ start:2268 stop:3074 length:807 start_codon:yes stop_codon:yes gene_type:complete